MEESFMKKTLYILFAAAIAIATVACSKEELFNSDSKQPQTENDSPAAFDQGDATKTDLTQKGKTVWSKQAIRFGCPMVLPFDTLDS
jgi:hypothetical protein